MDLFRIVNAKDMPVSVNGYQSDHVFLNEKKCSSAVKKLNGKCPWYIEADALPFRMQRCVPVWEDVL